MSMFSYAPAHLTSAELEQLAGIFKHSRQAQTIPDEYREGLREIFIEAVPDLVGRYRAAIAYERDIATPGKIKDNLGVIAKRAENLKRDAAVLLEMLSSLDERTRAALLVDARKIDETAIKWLAEPWMHALAEAANVARARYPKRHGRVEMVILYRAGEAVRAFFERFSIPYARTANRDFTTESDAIVMFRIITGIKFTRIEEHLP